MSGNATYRSTNTAVLAVSAVDAPVVVTSDEIDERLRSTYERVGLKPGMLSRLAGIQERRWWPEDVSFADGAATAGAKALAEAGVDPSRIGLMINTSVSRAHLEPSTAVEIHHTLGLPTGCLNFDLANACLGFVNGMQLAAHDDRLRPDRLRPGGRRRGRRATPRSHPRPARGPGRHGEDVLAAVRHPDPRLGRGGDGARPGRPAPAGPPLRRLASRAPAPSTTTCASATWTSCAPTPAGCSRPVSRCPSRRGRTPWPSSTGPTWTATSPTRSRRCTPAPCARRLDIDAKKLPLSFPLHGNMGPAAVPFTLAKEADVAAPRRPGAAARASARA